MYWGSGTYAGLSGSAKLLKWSSLCAGGTPCRGRFVKRLLCMQCVDLRFKEGTVVFVGVRITSPVTSTSDWLSDVGVVGDERHAGGGSKDGWALP
jgi:hypothetical protein